jgi:protein-tyrosine phosphatase
MIETHFHCLPGIDDGPANWDDAVELCRAAAAEGTTAIVATPHVLRDPWINQDPAARDKAVMKLNGLMAGEVSILAGCEYYFSLDAIALVERGGRGPLIGLNRSRYLLLEFASSGIPPGTDAVFHEISLLGVTPVIAHPERNRYFAEGPERLELLVSRGAVAQVTAGSLLGDFGVGPLAASQEFFRRGLIHVVASDAHSLARRPPRLAAARRWVRRSWGKSAESGLFDENPQAMIDSQPLPWKGTAAAVARK